MKKRRIRGWLDVRRGRRMWEEGGRRGIMERKRRRRIKRIEGWKKKEAEKQEEQKDSG